MVVIYTSAGCVSCRKAKQWLKQNNIEFIEKNIFNVLLDPQEIIYLLSRSENGSDDIISKRSKVLQESKIDIDSMTITELVKFVKQNPSVLKRPIIINERNLLVGFDEEEIEGFLPLETCRHLMNRCEKDCPNYRICGAIREE